MAKDSPSVEALAALDQIIEGFTTFRSALQAAFGGDGPEGSDDSLESEVPRKPARGTGKAAKAAAADLDDDEEPVAPRKGKGTANGDAGKRKGKKAKTTITFDELKTAFTKFIKDHGTKEAKTLLGTLGVDKLGELDEDQYADAMSGIEAAFDEIEKEEEDDLV